MSAMPRVLAVTMGDPAGIGPEIIEAAWAARAQHALPPFAVFADPGCFSGPVKTIEELLQAPQVFESHLPVIPVILEKPAIAGKADKAHAPAILQSIERAVKACLTGKADAVVTAPVAKSVLYDAGFTYPGQTEFLAALTQTPVHQAVMMLASPELRVVPLTIHMALADVPRHITQDLILSRVRVTAQALVQDFDIKHPRIAICGLNPHAGENGAMGREEPDIIRPAIIRLQAEGIDVQGPFPADTMFHLDARKTYDAAIAMYHDQALIPLKTLDFHGGVNTTLGLPVLRTSPDHGTAFNIAGKGRANPSSMIAAIKLAAHMAGNRARYSVHHD